MKAAQSLHSRAPMLPRLWLRLLLQALDAKHFCGRYCKLDRGEGRCHDQPPRGDASGNDACWVRVMLSGTVVTLMQDGEATGVARRGVLRLCGRGVW